MTKTKQQLRAEAVERLNGLVWLGASPETIVEKLIPEGLETSRHDYGVEIKAIIDLLTDDEPPEGDAVAILRKAATCTSRSTSVGDVLRYNVPRVGNPSAWEYAEDACEALADMIERDYVRKDAAECDIECYECSRLAELIAENTALRLRLDKIEHELESEHIAACNSCAEVINLQESYDAIANQCAELCKLCGFSMVDANGEVIA